MTKKLFIIIPLLLTFISVALQGKESKDGTPVKLTVKVTKPTGEHDGPSRTLTDSVYVYQDGHTFTFDSAQVGATISIVKEGEEVYSDIVDLTCTVTIPESATGTVEIILTQNGITYWAQIVL